MSENFDSPIEKEFCNQSTPEGTGSDPLTLGQRIELAVAAINALKVKNHLLSDNDVAILFYGRWQDALKATPALLTKQQLIDVSNLRFYARMFQEHKWQTDAMSWTVFDQTLNEMASRIENEKAIPEPTDWRSRCLAVPCGKCGAPIGENCKWPAGLDGLEAFHLRRMSVADKTPVGEPLGKSEDCACGGQGGKHYNYHSKESCGYDPQLITKSKDAQLPPLDVTEEDIAEANRVVKGFDLVASSGAVLTPLEMAVRDGYAIIACRERQLRAALSVGKGQDDKCDVCCGDPLPNGQKCICGGSGKGCDEKVGLRLEVIRLSEELETIGKVQKEPVGDTCRTTEEDAQLPPLDETWQRLPDKECTRCGYLLGQHGTGLGIPNAYIPCEYCWLKERVRELETALSVRKGQDTPPVAVVRETCVGPHLLIYGVDVRSGFGTDHDERFHALARAVNLAALSSKEEVEQKHRAEAGGEQRKQCYCNKITCSVCYPPCCVAPKPNSMEEPNDCRFCTNKRLHFDNWSAPVPSVRAGAL